MQPSTIHEGGCLCGAIRYRVTSAPTALVVCHCRSCRLSSGAPSLAWAIFRAADFAFTRGAPAMFASSPGVERGFCSRCGTTLTYSGSDRTNVADVTKAQAVPLPTEIGATTAERLLAIVPGYSERKSDYQPDVSELEFMASSIKPEDRMEVYLGTWCPDSLREVPKLLKIVDVLRDRFGKPLPVSYVGVDRSKQKPPALVAGKSIEKVATFIYYRGDDEVGRIVERPTSPLFEDDLLALFAKR